ncbi:MAG: hypothetical protein ACLRPQ_01120 [Streptococcus sp.]
MAPEPVASEGAASQSQADQAASAPSVDPKKEVETSEPAGPSPIAAAEAEKADQPVGQEKTVAVTEKINLPQAPQGAGVPASPAASIASIQYGQALILIQVV